MRGKKRLEEEGDGGNWLEDEREGLQIRAGKYENRKFCKINGQRRKEREIGRERVMENETERKGEKSDVEIYLKSEMLINSNAHILKKKESKIQLM